jgi:hypothetical protein
MDIKVRDRAARRGPTFRLLICPTGKSVTYLSIPLCKNILVFARPKSLLYPLPSRPTEGRLAIVTDAGRDAVDVAVSLTNDA